MKSHFQVSKKWKVTDYTDSFLQIRPCKLLIFFFVLFSNFNLFEVTDTEQHFFPSINSCLKIEKVVILIFIMWRIWHRMMYNQVLDTFWQLVFWICELDLSTSFVMKMNNRHTYDCLVRFVVSLLIFLYDLF